MSSNKRRVAEVGSAALTGLALLARFRYPRALLALVDGGQSTETP